MRPGVVYSCMTVDPSDPPMVDARTPWVVERLAPGWTIRRFTALSIPGLSLWLVVGRRVTDDHPTRVARVVAHDASTDAVIEGEALFLRTASSSAHERARWALSILVWRAEERPLTRADASTVTPSVRDSIRDPRVEDGALVFWARVAPGLPYAREIRVDLATGRANVGVFL